MEYGTAVHIARGGMAEVSKAWDEGLQRHVALKHLRWDDPELVERLLREARAQARLDHPNICRVYQVGEHLSRPTIAMQYVDGPPLGEAAPEMTLEEKVRVVHDVAAAVHHAHAAGIIHRDLKPGNILVERQRDGGWHPWVVDFGIAHEVEAPGLTRTGQVMGTPCYMAPEQIVGEPGAIDRRTDVYALGAVLYELLGGRPPFQGETDVSTMMEVVSREPTPLRSVVASVPRDLETVVMRCLAKEPERRYQNAAELAADLDRWMTGRPVTARPTTWAERMVYRTRRHPVQAALVAALVVTLLVLAGTWLHGRQTARAAARIAQRFGRDVERIDARVRQSSLLPAHDVRPDLAAVRTMVADLEAELSRLGRIAAGPGHYAIGRARLALGELDEARRHLELSAAAGESSPEHAYTLGMTLAALYRERMSATAGILDSDLRDRERQRARHDLLEPALARLRRADVRDTGEALLARGLLALFEERFDDAVQRAQEAVAEDPWLYEALRLEGDVALARETTAFESGDYDETRAQLQLAGKAFGRAIRVGRSDPGLYEADCERYRRLVDLEIVVGGPLEDAVEGVAERCSQAMEIHPEQASVHRLLALFYARYGHELWWNRGEDPVSAFDAAVGYASKAVELAPEDASTHGALGAALLNRARWVVDHGEDADELLQDAADAYGTAIELAPSMVSAHLDLAKCHLMLATQVQNRGGDPRAEFELARQAAQGALHLAPAFVGSLSLLGSIHLWRADWESTHGIDPRPQLSAALEAYDEAAGVNPSSPRLLNNIGLTAWILGDTERMLGLDPRASLDRAEEMLREALAIKPDHVSSRINLAGVHFTRAQHALANGAESAGHIQASLDELRRIREAYPDDFHVDWADCLILEARRLLRQGRSPEEELRHAIAEVEAGVELYPGRAPQLRALGEAHLVRAQWLAEQGHDASTEVAAGLRAVDRALEIDPSLAKAHAVRGRLQLAAAETATGPRQSDRARDAVTALERALDINPFLAEGLQESLAHAKNLLGG